jgi:hypothetical protein
MQFRPVGIERPGDELAPEGAKLGKGLCDTVAAVRRGGKGRRSDRCHDAASVFPLAACREERRFVALKTSFGLIY